MSRRKYLQSPIATRPSQEERDQIEDYRSRLRPIPTVSEAIRRLMALGLRVVEEDRAGATRRDRVA
jgi:hypothetical protein